MSMEVNGSNGAQSANPSVVKLSQQDKMAYASIYDMLQNADTDSNSNWVLDAKDFKDKTLYSFAAAKGLIGKNWNAAIEYVKGIISNKKEPVTEMKKDVYNEKTGEYYDSTVQNGREISRTYYKTDENGNRVVDEVIYLEYDKNGKIHEKKYMDSDGNLKDSAIVSPDDESKVLSRTQYNEEGQWEKYAKYDDQGNVFEVAEIKRDVDEYNQKTFTKTKYTKNGDNWVEETEKGFDDVKFTPKEPYITYEPKQE